MAFTQNGNIRNLDKAKVKVRWINQVHFSPIWSKRGLKLFFEMKVVKVLMGFVARILFIGKQSK